MHAAYLNNTVQVDRVVCSTPRNEIGVKEMIDQNNRRVKGLDIMNEVLIGVVQHYSKRVGLHTARCACTMGSLPRHRLQQGVRARWVPRHTARCACTMGTTTYSKVCVHNWYHDTQQGVHARWVPRHTARCVWTMGTRTYSKVCVHDGYHDIAYSKVCLHDG